MIFRKKMVSLPRIALKKSADKKSDAAYTANPLQIKPYVLTKY